MADLCLGYVGERLVQPELQARGWRARLPLKELMHHPGWRQAPASVHPLTAWLSCRRQRN
ncbi:hypothetical protein [Marinobacterium aestuariivivens]|uniref:LysR substrate-binding domain-containing protein n=1 Tax=Marinobacterium aestuariivivens TaxID=1698799 RepID=A0ABW2A6C4_9GAMM